ncbi:hypothetical protein IFM46972_09453 [Aspergillus udagawae]|uniref:Major facilitator superfamily (MFS) profile domain-containing protein n=1 Tax=Aspergillus udagawae TaxID=91492 RepID=A0A8H3XKQ3_9EURO|nr:hypothetical protein IFM46972_09453 [Aspergillus udagawae]
MSEPTYEDSVIAGEKPNMSTDVTQSKVESHVTEIDDEDGRDPRKWRPRKKLLVFIALMSSSILADGGMTWGATLIVPQALEWEVSVDHSATSMNYGILLQGVGGLIAIPLIEAYGRLPVWLWPQFITTFMVLGATLSNNYSTFIAFRSLQGFFGTIPQVVGLPIIHDIYEQKGPALAGYIGAGSNWKVSFGILTAFYALSTILIFLFGRETYYARGQQCQRNSRLQSMFGIKNHNLPVGRTLAYWTKILAIYIFKLPLLLTGIATMVNFCWPIGGFLFSQHKGYAFGYWFNGWIEESRQQKWRPEYRLHGVWFAVGVMACGLLTYGMTLNYRKSWIGLAFGWLMVVFGMISSTVSITAYNLEKYPDQSTVVSAIINAWRTASGFSVGYFQPSWIAKDGTAAVFGTQVAVVVAVLILTITPVIVIEGRKAKPTMG